ncbi:MAG: hypothetical protein AB1414_04105 [bacterium]
MSLNIITLLERSLSDKNINSNAMLNRHHPVTVTIPLNEGDRWEYDAGLKKSPLLAGVRK